MPIDCPASRGERDAPLSRARKVEGKKGKEQRYKHGGSLEAQKDRPTRKCGRRVAISAIGHRRPVGTDGQPRGRRVGVGAKEGGGAVQ